MAGGLLGLGQTNAGLLGGLLGQMQPRRAQPPAPLPSPAPQRERVSGWRLLDRVLGGQTVSEGLDAERARLETEAMRPQQMARMQQMREAASRMGPEAMIAFETNPEAFGESLGMQYRPVTTAAGSITSYGPGEGSRRVAAPVVDRFDDRHGVLDPLNPQAGTQYTTPRGPTHAEDTNRLKVQEDARQFGERLGLDREKLAVDAQVGLGGLAVNQAELGLKQDEVSREEQERAAAQAEAVNAAKVTADNMAIALTRAREFSGSAGAYQFLNPLNRQGRANLEAQIDTLQGNLTLDKLMEMKANSPTGASGMGALSEQEGRLLAATVASLSPDMNPEELERSFQVIDGLIAKMRQPAAPAQGGVSREAAIAELRRRGLI